MVEMRYIGIIIHTLRFMIDVPYQSMDQISIDLCMRS